MNPRLFSLENRMARLQLARSHEQNIRHDGEPREYMSPLILLLVLVLVLMALPAWPYSRNWGYYPSGGLGLVLVILLVLLLLGRL